MLRRAMSRLERIGGVLVADADAHSPGSLTDSRSSSSRLVAAQVSPAANPGGGGGSSPVGQPYLADVCSYGPIYHHHHG